MKLKTLTLALAILASASARAEVSGDWYDYTVTGQPERPYIHDYRQKMLMKFYMSDPDRAGRSTNIYMTYEQALENIKAIDRISRGIPKIVYLVGWQFNGHDDRYPDFDVMNEALKRPCDATALDSYRWLREEAAKYNTTVSVHLLVGDAYTNAPSWDEYVAKGYICRDENGRLMTPGVLQGYPMYWVNLYNEWRGGDLQQRLDDVVDMLDIADAGTIHFDAFLPNPSPWHGVTREMQESTMRKVLRYMRDKGIDVTAELFCYNGRDPMIGLQPAAWWNDMPAWLRAKVGPELATGGVSGALSTDKWPEVGFLFGDNAQAEDTFHLGLGWDSFIREFATQTLPCMLFNSRRLESYDPEAKRVTYSGGLVADAKAMTLTEGDRLLRRAGDLLIPTTWTPQPELMAYSEHGYQSHTWQLPPDWAALSKVKAYPLGPDGAGKPETIPVKNGSITLSMAPNTLLSIRQ